MRVARLYDPEDPRLAALSALLYETFPDPNTVLGLDRMQEFLGHNPAREFHVLVAIDDRAVIGGTVFSYVVASNCGFSEYIVVGRDHRRTGLGRRLFDARKTALDAAAQRHGNRQCEGLFIEADSPDRTPAQFVEMERESALDTRERLRLFKHLGFRRVDVRYVQPPLAPGKVPIAYLDLLFAPWQLERASIPAGLVLQTVEAIWSAWTPGTFGQYLAALRQELGEQVALLELSAA